MGIGGKILVCAAVVAVLIGVSYTRVDGPAAKARFATAPVVVAQTDMPEGATIGWAAVVVAQWPVGTIPPGAFTSIDSLTGRVTRVPVFKGEALVPGRLAPDGTGPGLEVRITPGKRAMSFRIDDVSGIAGLIHGNSRVDILVVDGGADRAAKPVVENMRVLAIGAVPHRSEDGRAINAFVATVEVTPDESAKLARAIAQGAIHLVLRGYGDPDSAKASGATAAQIVEWRNRRKQRGAEPYDSAPRRR